MNKRWIPIILLLALTGVLTVLHAQAPGINVTNAMILHPSADTRPVYNGDYTGRRFSTLVKINDKNVKNLSLAWTAAVSAGGGGGGFGGASVKGTALLVNGTLFGTVPDNVTGMDARTGGQLSD